MRASTLRSVAMEALLRTLNRMTVSSSAIGFAHFLHSQQADIIAEWSRVAEPTLSDPVASGSRAKAVSRLVEGLAAAAEGRRESPAPVVQDDAGDVEIEVGRTVSDHASDGL
jgi:hypothetical protein